MIRISALALALGMLTIALESGKASPSVDSTGIEQRQPRTQTQRTLSLGINSCFDIELLNPRGARMRVGTGVPDREWRKEYSCSWGTPGRITQIHVDYPYEGTWKLRVAVDRDMKVLSIDAFSDGGCSASDFLTPMKRDRAQWWKLKLSWNATRDTCSMKLVRWKQERLTS